MAKPPSDLIFEALCLRYRSTTNVSKIMTRQELQEATGLSAEALVDALRDLVGPVNEDLPIHFVDHDSNKITLDVRADSGGPVLCAQGPLSHVPRHRHDRIRGGGAPLRPHRPAYVRTRSPLSPAPGKPSPIPILP